jgi:hypothetical protein
MNRGTGAGVYRWGSRWDHSFGFGPHTTLFQAEIYDIKVCIMEYIKKHLYSFQQLNSQTANKALDSFYIKSKLVWDCHQFLVKEE